MIDKFKNVPVEEDTTIKFRSVTKFENIDALHEGWYWEGKLSLRLSIKMTMELLLRSRMDLRL